MPELDGKVALVSGSSRGIGRATAIELARRGAHVVVTARTTSPRADIPGSIHETAAEITKLGRRALAVAADLRARADIERLVTEVRDEFGGIDILVNNAADTGEDMFVPFDQMTPEIWDRHVDLNLTAPFLLCLGFVPTMIERGGGVVVNLSSNSAQNTIAATAGQAELSYAADGAARPNMGTCVAYPTTKAAIERFGFALSKELRPHGIAVITVNPGGTVTERFLATAEERNLPQSLRDAMHPVAVPVTTITTLITCPDPLWYSGRVVVAADFVRDHFLISS